MMAADGEPVDMGQMAAGKDAHGRCPRAHVDQGGAEFGFIAGQGRKTRRVRRGDHRVDRQMAAFDREHQVARGGGVAAQHVHIRAEFIADHPPRILNVTRFAQCKADWQGVQHRPALLAAARRASLQHPVDIGLRNGPPGDRDLGIVEPRGKPAAGRVHDHAFDLHPSHALRRVDGETDGSFRRVHIDDGAALDPARALMSDAKNAATMAAPAQRLGRFAWVQPRDKTDDFRRSDVEHGKDRAFAGRQGRQARRQYLRIHVRPPFALVLLGSIAARSAAASWARRATTRPG